MDSESDKSVCAPPKITEVINNATMELIPQKSRHVYEPYEVTYSRFMEWRKTQNISSFSDRTETSLFSPENKLTLALVKHMGCDLTNLSLNIRCEPKYLEMETFTKINLEKYDAIIENIETEQSECDALKKRCEQLKNKLKILKLLKKPDLARERLFQVKAKIFSNTYQISEIFPDAIPPEELEETSKQSENCLFYFIEMFISLVFHENLITENWLINVSVSNKTVRITKSVNLKNRVSNPLCFLIPFDEDAHNVKIETYLVFPSDGDYWPNLKLTEITVDVSYRFSNITAAKKSSFKNEIVRINRMYNPEAFKEYVPKMLSYRFLVNWNKDFFIEMILRNSYHKLDPVNVFNEEKGCIVAKFSIDGILTVIELNIQNGTLKIEACARDLFLLKKYFGKFRGKLLRSDFEKVSSSKDLKEMVSKLQIADMNPTNIYYKYITYMSQFPL